jgi:ATP-binding cassette subfamily B protein/subfamily B ATP-binding cassette protein MsbA
MKNPFRALKYFRPDISRIVLVFLVLLVSIGFNLLKPWPVALIVDCVLGGKHFPLWLAKWLPQEKLAQLSALVVTVLLAHTFQALLSTAQNYWSIQIGLRGLTRVRNEVFGCLQRLSLRFHQGTKTGDLIHRASWDTYSFQTLFQQGVVTMVASLISLL